MPRATAIGVALLFCTLLLGACASPPPAISDNVPSSVMAITPTVSPGPAPEPTSEPTPTRSPRIVAIDPGHGGEDDSILQTDGDGRNYREGPNTGVGIYRADGSILWEKDLALDVAQRLQRHLAEMGYRAVLTRTEDRPVNDPPRDLNGDGEIDIADELQARNDAINESGAEIFVSIHFNGYSPTSRHGVTIYYCADRTFSDNNKLLADLVHDATWDGLASTGFKPHDNGVMDDVEAGGTPGHLALLGPGTRRVPRHTQVPGVLVEPLFLTDPAERDLIQGPAVRESLAQVLAQAIQEYLLRNQ